MKHYLSQEIFLESTSIRDLEPLFHIQLDERANHLAAFTSKIPADKVAFIEKYSGLLKDPEVNLQTIWLQDRIVGSIAKYVSNGKPEVTYWIDREYWGKGIASAALPAFLKMNTERPLYARVAFDNIASQRVLEKCGFIRIGTDKGFANARQEEIEEYVYQLKNEVV